jgi:hypothetical protein
MAGIARIRDRNLEQVRIEIKPSGDATHGMRAGQC